MAVLAAILAVCVASCVIALGVAQPASAAERYRVADASLVTDCNGTPTHVPVRWYIPDGPSTGLVWLQHGFSRTAANLAILAESYARSGLLVAATTIDSISLSGCGVAYNATDNTAFARSMGTVFAHGREPGSPLAHSLADAARQVGRSDVTLPDRVVFSGHSAGGEFVLTAANTLRTTDPAGYRRLAGLMLFDPVNSFLGDNFRTAAADLGAAGLPIRVIASPPSVSNIGGLGVRWLEETTQQHFLGVQLTTGVHIDVEGESTDLIGIASELAVPRPRNGRVLRRLADQWALDLLTRTRTASYYPGGDYYQLLVSTKTVTTLPIG